MSGFASLLAVLLIAVFLASLARRIGVPYPAFLALGGAVLAFVPGAPRFTIDPEVALALFVAPVLLDAAYDSSPRDLKDNWIAIGSLAIVAVALTTLAVAWVARALVPAMPGPPRSRWVPSSPRPTPRRRPRCSSSCARRIASS
jgi:CPA1 family monovalent cation:H+ antiporter